MTKKSHRERYGTTIEDIRIDHYSVQYYPLFLVRRLLFSICLIFLYDWLSIQLLVAIVFLLIPVRLFAHFVETRFCYSGEAF